MKVSDSMVHKCQVCGSANDATSLFDIKGNVPGGCKLTCLRCCGRLEEREACAKVAEGKDWPSYCVAAAIRARTVGSG